MSTPSASAELEIVDVLLRDRRRRQRHARGVDAFVLADRCLLRRQSSESRAVARLDLELDQRRRRAAGDRLGGHSRASPSNVVETRPGPPTKVARRDREARRRTCRSSAVPPSSAPGADLRPREILQDGHFASGTRRRGARRGR